jgi:hypothetical protein
VSTGRERLLEGGLQTVTLPSGVRVRGVLPHVADLVRRRLIPQELMVALIAAEAREQRGEPLTPEEHDARVQDQYIEAAAFVRAVELEDGTWERVSLTADDLRNGGMVPDDLESLIAIATGIRTPVQVDAESRLELGLMEPAEAEAIREREAASTVTGWAGFRDNAGGDAPREDGGDVAHDTVEPPPARGRRRASARRGSSRATPQSSDE